MTTRRTFVAGAASLAVPAAPAIAAPEPNHERVRRLCNELSDALSGYFDGQFGAEILPRSIEPTYAVMLFDIDSRNEVMQQRRTVMALVEALCEARREGDRLREIARTQRTPSGIGSMSVEWLNCLDHERVERDALKALMRVAG